MHQCMQCMKTFTSSFNLKRHQNKAKCAQPMTDDEFELLMPSWEGPWKVWCIACNHDVSITYIGQHLWYYHADTWPANKTWAVMKDQKAIKQGKSLDVWSNFQFQWDIKKTATDRLEAEQAPHRAAHVPLEIQVQGAPETDGNDTHSLEAQRPPAAAHAGLAEQIVLSENRILDRVDSVVMSFNQVLKEGLGEVSAKYPVFISPGVLEFDPLVHGFQFPINKLSTTFDIGLFQTMMFEFRGLKTRTAQDTIRDIKRFLGCFDFPGDAGTDLSHLAVSIFKAGLLRQLMATKLWTAKSNFLKSLKWSLHHFLGFLENEERLQRAFGGLTSALGNIVKALDWELSHPLRAHAATQKEKKAQKDAERIEQWVGSDVWGSMVLKAMQVLTYIHDHKDDEGFFSKGVHQLANQALMIIIFLNCFPGRCGGWELLDKDEVLREILKEEWDNIITIYNHKTKNFYGPLKKWTPNSIHRALLMYSLLPLRDSELFIVSHTPTDYVCASHILQCACKTFGHPGAVPDTTFCEETVCHHCSHRGQL